MATILMPNDTVWRMLEDQIHQLGLWVCSANGVRQWVEFNDDCIAWVPSNPLNEEQNRVLEQLQEQMFVAGARLNLCFQLGIRSFLQVGETCCDSSTDTFGHPDVFVKESDSRALIVGVVDVHHTIEDGVRRLFTYMLLTGARFGVVAGPGAIRYAKIETNAEAVELYLSSISAGGAIGFLLHLARSRVSDSNAGDSRRFAAMVDKFTPRVPDVVQSFKSIAAQLKSPNSSPGSQAVMAAVEYLKFGELEDVRSKSGRVTDSFASIVSAVYQGKKVLLKVWDMTEPWLVEDKTILQKRIITEVDAYKTLHKLQGVHIPELVSWGFLCGTMFAYIMTSDDRTAAIGRASEFSVQDTEAATASAREALARIHTSGMLHGDISNAEFLLGSDGKVRIAGFSNASYVKQKEMPVAGASEMAELEQVLENLLARHAT